MPNENNRLSLDFIRGVVFAAIHFVDIPDTAGGTSTTDVSYNPDDSPIVTVKSTFVIPPDAQREIADVLRAHKAEFHFEIREYGKPWY
ncbi:Uncharacterised protein [Mycobacteroides abscessus subsp. abscessus]|uniref:Uncharacterized protein n=1 Tax=Mycobacteroides abscessus TaxID=36809 RepID=A0AB33SXM2_9MYCO|nr:hypothetical protein [Mycobacteroides abscessus]EIC65113.1 hypothetical protein S7W_18770 [Mycobacteroides abscessus M94]MBE5439471.1 hypothetical protein [Mycobacteroides abscessus]MBE5466418.1 hypothetical protein [Mycobacteroides abscessus]MBN7369333.1 hypothetical protein [Mycobacteroides abscessus subsp. abscessus]MBN7491994.1 hypothetical protein [Mycobacteroides abscessus subsp. abscessus]